MKLIIYKCPRGGMADALALGASPGNRVEVQLLSGAQEGGACLPAGRVQLLSGPQYVKILPCFLNFLTA